MADTGITSQEILDDIDFELMQGIIRQDDLGNSIQTVRKFQNELRTQLLEAVGDRADAREIVVRQNQLNDMLLTLLQEMSIELRSLQYTQYQMGEWTHRKLGLSAQDGFTQDASMIPAIKGAQTRVSPPSFWSQFVPQVQDDEIRHVMNRNALGVTPEIQGMRIPLLGPVLQRLRGALHNIAIFYVQRLADRQADVNQIYGAKLLELDQTHTEQQHKIAALLSQISELQRQVQHLETQTQS
jgi:hypothetical protein